MNTKLTGLEPLALEGAEIQVVDDVVHINGVLAMRSASELLTPYLRRVHEAAVLASPEKLTVDLTKLNFVNSSSIRSFVDWIEWIRREPESSRYVLRFITKPNSTWQATTVGALQVHGGTLVVVQRGK